MEQNNGLLTGAQPQMAPAPAPAAPMPQQGQPPVGKQPVASSLDNRDYDAEPPNEKDEQGSERMTLNAMRMLHDPKASQTMVQSIKSAEHPIQGISNVANQVMRRAEEQEMKENGSVNDFMRLSSALVITNEVMELAKASGIQKEFTEEEKQVALAQTIQDWQKEEIGSGRRTAADSEAQVQKHGSAYAESMQGAPADQVDAPSPDSKNDPFNPDKTMTEKLNGGLL